MHIEQIAPGAGRAAVQACYEIYLSGIPDDDPSVPPMSLRLFTGWLELGWTEDPQETWLATDDAGQPGGWYLLTLPQRENRHLAMVTPVVHAARRRAGLGTVLLRHAARRAAHHGRSQLSGSAWQSSPGSAFARACRATPGLTEIRRVLRLADLSAGRRAELRSAAAAAASGYELVSWAGPAPEEQLPALAAIYGDAADMPREPDREPQQWDVDRVRQEDRRTVVQGLRSYSVAARHPATGALAGLTQLLIEPEHPDWAFQALTVVARAHRGHRLGLLVKVAMLDLLAEREPQLARILTGNADGNEHMIAINAELGYAVLDYWPSWDVEVAPLLTRPTAAPHPTAAP
jgi:GNAT superfamily N-acetyltransferase